MNKVIESKLKPAIHAIILNKKNRKVNVEDLGAESIASNKNELVDDFFDFVLPLLAAVQRH